MKPGDKLIFYLIGVMKFGGWQRLNAEYAQRFGVDAGWPTEGQKR